MVQVEHAQLVTWFVPAIDADLGMVNSKNLFRIRHHFAGKLRCVRQDLRILCCRPCVLPRLFWKRGVLMPLESIGAE